MEICMIFFPLCLYALNKYLKVEIFSNSEYSLKGWAYWEYFIQEIY